MYKQVNSFHVLFLILGLFLITALNSDPAHAGYQKDIPVKLVFDSSCDEYLTISYDETKELLMCSQHCGAKVNCTMNMITDGFKKYGEELKNRGTK